MRTTRDNQGKGDIKDRQASSRPDKPHKAAEPRKAAGQTRRDTSSGTPERQSYSSRGKRTNESARDGSTTGKVAKSSGYGIASRVRSEGGFARKTPTRTTVATRKEVTKPTESIRETDFLSGRNPVMEALRSGRPISKLHVTAGDHQGSIREIIALAKEKGVPVQITEQIRLDAMSLGIRNQGVVAMVSPVAYSSLDEIIAIAEERQEKPCILLLDQLKDPQNLGAVLRTADAAGAHGVLIPQRRSCQLSASVAKASAGAIEYVKVAQIGNVAKTLEDLKKQGFWVVGTES